MTNPYAPPDAESDPEEPGGTTSLLKQFLCQAVAAAGIPFVWSVMSWVTRGGEVWLEESISLLNLAFASRAWFCRDSWQLITAAIAISFGFHCSLFLIESIQFSWIRHLSVILVVTITLVLIGWPFMALGRRRRHQRLASQPSGESQ